MDGCFELTIEANPGTLDEEKLLVYRDAGINRLSIGLQAWQNHLLESLGEFILWKSLKKIIILP